MSSSSSAKTGSTVINRHDSQQNIIKNFLRAHGSQTIRSLKVNFKNHKLQLPFANISENAYHDWLVTISGVSHRTVNGKTEYFVNENYPESDEPPVTPSLQMSETNSPQLQSTPNRCWNKERVGAWRKQQDDEPCLRRQKPSRAVKTPRPFAKKPFKATAALQERQGMPNLYDFTLVGDQNILNYALFDLKFVADPDHRIRQSGLCVSGMRIRDATEKIRAMEPGTLKKVIINVGSVDIAENQHLIEMISDLDELLELIKTLGINAVLTTLAPLPNYLTDHKKQNVDGFNLYIRRYLSPKWPVIDIHECMVKADGTVNFNCYQGFPRFISGTKAPFILWNQIGRNRVGCMLRKNLGFALVKEGNFIGRNF